MSRRSKDVTKNTFMVIFIDALETNFYERLYPKRINDYLIRKARRQQLNDQMGPVKLSVFEDHLELTKNLWWPNGTSPYLPYTQLRDVFPLESEGKKFALGVANERTRQRRVLVFKAKNVRQCEQLVDTLQNCKQYQQSYESETARSASRLEYDSRQSFKAESPTTPYYRPMSAVSFMRSTSMTDCSQPTLQPEQRRPRYQSLERVSFAEAQNALQPRYDSPQRFSQYAHPYPDGQYATRQRASKLHRVSVNGTNDEYQRSASAVPAETYKILVPRPASRLSKVDRSAMQYTQVKRTQLLPDYLKQTGLPRSNSIQALVYPTNGAVDLESPSLQESVTETINGKTAKQNNSIHIHIQTSPRDTLEYGKSHAPVPQTRATSPTRPPEYESLLGGEQYNYKTKQQLQQRSRPPVTIVREMDYDKCSATELVTLPRAENQLTRYAEVTSISRPPLPTVYPVGQRQQQENGERECKRLDIYRNTEIPVKSAAEIHTNKGMKENHQKHYYSKQYVTEMAIQPIPNRVEYHPLTKNAASTLNTYRGSQSSLDDSDRSSYIDERVLSTEMSQVPMTPTGGVRIKLNNYTLRKRDTAEFSERGSRTLYAARKTSTETR